MGEIALWIIVGVAVCFLTYKIESSYVEKIINGKQFIHGDATYICKKTNELKVGNR